MTARTDIVREALAEMSDVDFQRRVWAGHGDMDEVSSFDECMSHLFDDSGIGDDLDRNSPVFDAAVDADLRTLLALVQRIDPLRHPDEVIDDPLMREARQQAASIMRRIARGDETASR